MRRRSRNTSRTPGTHTMAGMRPASIHGREKGRSPTAGRSRRLRRWGVREVFVPEDAALERERDGSRPAGAVAGFVCRGARGCERDRRHGAGQAGSAGGCAVLDAGTDRGAWHRCRTGHDLAQGVLRRAHGAGQDERDFDIQWRALGTEVMAVVGGRRWLG